MRYFQIQSLRQATQVVASRDSKTCKDIAKEYSANGQVVLKVDEISADKYAKIKLAKEQPYGTVVRR